MKLLKLLKDCYRFFSVKDGFFFYFTKKGLHSGNMKVYKADNGRIYIMLNGRYTFLTLQQLNDLNIYDEELTHLSTGKKKK